MARSKARAARVYFMRVLSEPSMWIFRASASVAKGHLPHSCRCGRLEPDQYLLSRHRQHGAAGDALVVPSIHAGPERIPVSEVSGKCVLADCDRVAMVTYGYRAYVTGTARVV